MAAQHSTAQHTETNIDLSNNLLLFCIYHRESTVDSFLMGRVEHRLLLILLALLSVGQQRQKDQGNKAGERCQDIKNLK